MAEEKSKAQKEKEQKKRQRTAALANLKGNIGNLASVYIIENTGFGEPVSAAVEEMIYNPAMALGISFVEPKSGQKGNIFDVGGKGLRASRINGKRYTGSINEMTILENAAGILQSSLNYVTVEDVFNLMGAESSYSEKIKGKISELFGKGKDIKDFYVSQLPEEQLKAVVGSYQGWLAYSNAAGALNSTAKKIPGQLEKILSGEVERKKTA